MDSSIVLKRNDRRSLCQRQEERKGKRMEAIRMVMIRKERRDEKESSKPKENVENLRSAKKVPDFLQLTKGKNATTALWYG